MAKPPSPKNRFWEYALVFWWLLTIVATAFSLVYGAETFGFLGGVGAGIIVFATSFIIRTLINIKTEGQFSERHYLRN